MENSTSKNSEKLKTNCKINWWFGVKSFFWTPLSRPSAKPVQSCAGIFKIIAFSSKSNQKVIQKLTQVSSSYSLRKYGVEDLGSAGWPTQFPHANPQEGKRTLAHLVFTFCTLGRATHPPSRSLPHQPSLAREQTITSIYPSGEKA